MADGLGLAASIIAVLQITTSVASLSYQYLSSAVRAPDSLRELTLEFQTLITILSNLKICAQDPQAVALQAVKNSLHVCHKEMLGLQHKLRPRKDFFGRLRWPLDEKDIQIYLLRIERFKSSFSLALEADQSARTKLVVESVQKMEIEIGGLSNAQNCQMERERDQMRRDALNWLFPEPFEKRHIEVSSQRKKNTGQWIFKTQEVQDWMRGNPNCRLLWGYGIPGAGKTFLSSLVIDRIEGLSANNGVGYIYFNFQEQGQQAPIDILSSLVKQLASKAKVLPEEVKKAYKENKRLTLDQLYEILVQIRKSFLETFIILDALDECHQVFQRETLLPMFHRMGKAGINLFLTSREHPEDIQQSFANITKMRLWAKHDDISSYIEQRIADNDRAKRLISQGSCDLKERIIAALQECANGMFLLVRFHIESLCQQTNLKQILAELESIKSSPNADHPMDPTYDRAMKNINMQQESCRKLAFKIISWLTKARKVLTVRELQLAVSVEQDDTTFDEASLPDRKTVLDVCSSLITIDETSDCVRFVHFTAQEFLTRNQLVPNDADYQVAIACTTFLSYDIFSVGSCDRLYVPFYTNSLLKYAARELKYHLGQCDELLTAEVIIRFLRGKGNVHTYTHHNNAIFTDCRRRNCTFSELEAAAFLGNNSVIMRVIREWGDVNSPEFRLYLARAFFIVVRQGNSLGLGLLLENGADANIQDSRGRTALYRAALEGHEAVVKLLLENGADANIQNSRGETALYRAAYQGHEAVVKLLLENGADANTQNPGGETALYRAAYQGHEAVVKLLLENGADANIQNSRGETALHCAALGGHEALVKLLLENGADANIQDSCGRTALYQAALEGHEAVVKLLLENGADANIQNSRGETALHCAALEGHEAVVKLLLENGADANIQDSYGRTALYRAAYFDREAVVKLLLENGADANTQNPGGETALYRAAYQGHEAVVKLLLENGADANIQDSDGKTALYWAADQGHKAVVKLLLENGADANIQDSDGGTALYCAALEGHEAVVKLLLENGADANIQDSWGKTALYWAAREGHEAVVKLLLENGADANIQDSWRETALDMGRINEHKAIVKLLENAANTKLQHRNK